MGIEPIENLDIKQTLQDLKGCLPPGMNVFIMIPDPDRYEPSWEFIYSVSAIVLIFGLFCYFG